LPNIPTMVQKLSEDFRPLAKKRRKNGRRSKGPTNGGKETANQSKGRP